MNIKITNIINKSEIIDYFDNVLHDSSYSLFGFDKEKKEFFVDVPWIDLDHARQKKVFGFFHYLVCSILTVRIIIKSVDKYILKTEDPDCVDYFLDWNLKGDILTVNGVFKTHQLWLTPESEIHLQNITESSWDRIIHIRANKWQRMKKAEEIIKSN
jgi:hypothetical protein